MALMTSGDSPSAPAFARAISSPPVSGSGASGTGRDAANPSAGPRRRDVLQQSVFGTEYANPTMWGPSAPAMSDAMESGADEASENYAGGDRQPQIQPVAMDAMGLRAASVPQDLSATSRGSTTVGNKRAENRMPLSTNLGQPLGGVGYSRPPRGGAPYRLGTTLGTAIAQGGVRAAGMLSLPGHLRGSTAITRGPTA